MDTFWKEFLPQPLPDSLAGIKNAMREAIQSLALLGLWRSRFFDNAAFYGGTALRVLYGLDRFSEDIDFSLLAPDPGFDFSKYGNALRKELESFGLNVEFEQKKKQENTAIESAFLKLNTYQQLLLIQTPEELAGGIHPQSLLKIKLEVDTMPPGKFNTEIRYVFQPLQFAVRAYDLPSLFAGKIHALLYRKWKKRVKGRDWYDFAWYCSKHPVINLLHLEERMKASGDLSIHETLSHDSLKQLLFEAIDSLDIDNAKKDVIPFVRNPWNIDLWSKDFFRAGVDRIQLPL